MQGRPRMYLRINSLQKEGLSFVNALRSSIGLTRRRKSSWLVKIIIRDTKEPKKQETFYLRPYRISPIAIKATVS